MDLLQEFMDQALLTSIIGIACFVVGAWLGSQYPDIDRWDFLRLRHRSGVTHSFLLPSLLWLGGSLSGFEWAGWIGAGFAGGVALHLAFDLFPGKWRGFALIDVPNWGRCTRSVSTVWLYANLFLCVFISVSILPTLGPAGVLAYAGTLAALYFHGILAKKEHFAAGPLLTVLTLGGDAL